MEQVKVYILYLNSFHLSQYDPEEIQFSISLWKTFKYKYMFQ